MLTVQVDIDKGIARQDRLPDDIRNELKTEVRQRAIGLRAEARSLASGHVLKMRTGRYVKSIRYSVRSAKTSVVGRVYTRNPLANIFEYGDAHIPPHIIEPKNVKALHFVLSGGGDVYAAHAMHPGATISQRSVIFSSFGQQKQDIRDGIVDAMRRGTKVNATGRSIPAGAPYQSRE